MSVKAIVIEVSESGMVALSKRDIGDDTGTLKGLQEVVGGFVDVMSLAHDETEGPADMWFNDEGKIQRLPLNQFATILAMVFGGLAAGDFVVGNVVLAGHNPDTGETTDIPEGWWDLLARFA